MAADLAPRLQWDESGLVARDRFGRRQRHPWGDVVSLWIDRGRWDMLQLDVSDAWFDTVPAYVVVELSSSRRIRRRIDRDRLVRFDRTVGSADRDARRRPVSASFLRELDVLLGRASEGGDVDAPDAAGFDDGW